MYPGNPRLLMLVALIAAALQCAASGGDEFELRQSEIVRGNVRFQALSTTVIRMEYSPKADFVDDPSITAINRDKWPGTPVASEEKDGWLTVSTGKLSLRHKLDSGPFAADNLLITWAGEKGERSWKPGDVDDKNLGGILDKRDSPLTEPGLLSRNGWFLLDDSWTALLDSATDWVKPRPEKDSQDWYFFVYGGDYAHMLAEFSELTGKIPMVPRYVLGAWFTSRAGYSAQQWQMIVEQFREESLPLDVLVLDSDSTTKVIWSGYDWDYEQMPDPKAFFEWIRQLGVKATVNEHYADLTRESDSNFDAIRQAMGLPEDTQDIPHNIADKKYAELFMDLLHKPALDAGMAFWWQDGVAVTNMEGLDPFLWTRHVEYEGTERITGKRTIAFCRLGLAWGSHRYGTFFTGDQYSTWQTLGIQLETVVRGGNSLVAYVNNDCGAIWGVQLAPELYRRWVQFAALSPIFRLHSIWGQRLPWEYGQAGMQTYRKFVGLRYALIPYAYTYSRIAHDTGLPLVRGMYLEYPQQESSYNYQQQPVDYISITSITTYPQQDPPYKYQQQYMFGRELLVAPVTESFDGKPAAKDVHLPARQYWFDYFTGDIYRGGRTITHECPIDRMPLFVRAGSIIPMAPEMDHSDQKAVDPLTLDIYAGPDAAEFRLYEDDGTSLDYRKGSYAWTPLSLKPTNEVGDYILRIGPSEGTFRGQLTSRRYAIRLHGLLKPEGVKVDGRPLSEASSCGCEEDWNWDPNGRVTTINLSQPRPTSGELILVVSGAGTFADAYTLQKGLNLREQVRQAKRVMKLKHAVLLGGGDIKKPPRVIRRTEEVERQLTANVRNPKGLANDAPDFEAMRKRILDALADQPFESNRTIPEMDPQARQSTKKIENGQFTVDEVKKIESILRGAGVPARLHP